MITYPSDVPVDAYLMQTGIVYLKKNSHYYLPVCNEHGYAPPSDVFCNLKLEEAVEMWCPSLQAILD